MVWLIHQETGRKKNQRLLTPCVKQRHVIGQMGMGTLRMSYWTSLMYTFWGFLYLQVFQTSGFPDGSDGKASACNAGDLGSIPGLGRSPGEGNGNPLQYSCLENPMDGGAWWATVHRVTKSRIWLSDFTHSLCILEHLYYFNRMH